MAERVKRKKNQHTETHTEAWAAVKRFNELLPQFQAFARMLTGNPKVTVRATADTPHTIGNTIFIRPPLALGKPVAHRRSECGKRDHTGRQACTACNTQEIIYFFLHHEISHIAFGTQAKPSIQTLDTTIKQVADWHVGCNHGPMILKQIREVRECMPIARAFAPYLGDMLNCLEDARVNNAMFEARPGLRTTFTVNVERLINEGTEDPSGEILTWLDAPLDAQFTIGLYLLTAGHDIQDKLALPVVEALADPELLDIYQRVTGAKNVNEIFQLTMEAFLAAQRLGFCRVPKCEISPDQSQPENTPEAQEEPERPEPEGAAGSEAPTGDSPEPGPGGLGDGAAGSGGDDAPEGSDPGVQPQLGDESTDSGGSAPGGGGSVSTADRTGDSSDRPDVHADETDGEADPTDADPRDGQGNTPKESDEDSGTPDIQDDAAGDQDQSGTDNDGVAPAGQFPATGQDSKTEDQPVGQDAPGNDHDGLSGEGKVDDESDRHAGRPADGDTSSKTGTAGADKEEEGSGQGEDIEEDYSEGVEYQEDSVDDWDTESTETEPVNPWDIDGPPVHDGPSDRPSVPDDGRTGAPLPTTGTPEDVTDAVGRFLLHGDGDQQGMLQSMAEGDDDLVAMIDHEGVELSDRIKEILAVAMQQMVWFDTSSKNVIGVDVAQFPVPYYWVSDADASTYKPPESILGRAVLQARRVFEENKRASHTVNLKSGKVNTRVLGRRAPLGDERLFKRKTTPTKRDYFVVLGIDCSASTDEFGRSEKIKRAAYAQAELLTRLGVPWAGYAHTAHSAKTNEFYKAGRLEELYLIMFPWKLKEEAWNDSTKAKLAGVRPVSGNVDGHTLEFYRKVAEGSTATDRLIFYYTDGEMPAANKTEEKEILIRELAYCKRVGIEVLGVGINTDSPKEYGMDTVMVESDEDIMKVIQQLDRRLMRK